MAVYDCFPFFNELDLLDLRLERLNGVVDHFVIVEATRTQTGNLKPLFFEQNKERYSKYLNKIVHIVVDDMPIDSSVEKGSKDSWLNENFQRNCIIRALVKCQPEDIIIVSDLDEIPTPGIIESINSIYRVNFFHPGYSLIKHIYQFLFHCVEDRKLFFNRKRKYLSLNEVLEITPIALNGDWFQYYANWKVRSSTGWNGPVMCKYKTMNMPQKLRDRRDWFPYISHSAYHFSWLGGTEQVLYKIKNVADRHSSIDSQSLNDALDKEKDIVCGYHIDKISILSFDLQIQEFLYYHSWLYRE